MREIIGSVFLVIGVLFDFLGCIGLVRLPDVYNRLQASTKCVTIGTSFIAFAAIIMGTIPMATKSLLIIIFIFITAPTSAHAISRASHIAGIKLYEGSVCDMLDEETENKEEKEER